MAQQRIGFIGVGLMGHGMAKNILARGFPLSILGNRNRAPVEALVAGGAKEVKSPAELAQASDVLFLCVTDSSVVEALVRGPGGIKAGAHAGLAVVDCSTSNPVSTMEIAAELEALGVAFADAPLSGTPTQAEEGKLGAMIGASPETLARIRPAVEAWAVKIDHLGPVGTGHKMKLINNFLAMGYAALFSEAFALGRKVDVPPTIINQVISGGRMDCGFFQTFRQYTLDGNREAHKFSLSNALKDMRYLEAMADSVGLANPIGNAVKNGFAHAVAIGRGEDYVPMLAEVVAEANGLKGRG